MNIRTHLPNLLLCLGGVSIAAAAADFTADADVLYRLHKAAVNRGDVETAMAYLSQDIAYVAGPNCPLARPCIGKDAVRKGFAEYAVSSGLRIVPVGASERGADATRTVVEVRWQGIEQLGVERLRGSDAVVLRNGKIASIVFTPDLSDPQTQKVYGPTAVKP